MQKLEKYRKLLEEYKRNPKSSKTRTHEVFIHDFREVEEWLSSRPEETRRGFASRLLRFCMTMNVEPEEWRSLDKFKARDLAWKYVQANVRDHPSVARSDLTALKSFYRNKDGERLPFDSGRGGKHYFHMTLKKAAIEHIPNKKEMFQIIDMAGNLRDKALLLFLFQSGVRVNVVEHITYGDVKDQLEQNTITLKITPQLDYKLRGRDINFYYTFINGEGATALKRFCEVKHKESSPNRPLFATYGNKAISQSYVWEIVKKCVKRTGFDPKTITTHTIRKAFRKIVRQTNIDDDDKEQLMGHVISGSRAAYYDRKDMDLIKKAYQHCNFTRETPHSETLKLRDQLETERVERASLEKRIDALESLLRQYINGEG
ncbi:tyrosine-type recombinase/integrase [Candidatus Bathyarchaeota archaeon]|nr:tyrosine-type recombinase/integrase [Candidatus Bathyarchaeota archaeon]